VTAVGVGGGGRRRGKGGQVAGGFYEFGKTRSICGWR